MSLFRWKERNAPIKPRPQERVVTRLVLLRKVAGEWRALGIERIRQRYGYHYSTEDRTYYKWHDAEWVE